MIFPFTYSDTPPEGTTVFHPDYLRSMSTIATGQADDLKLETGGLRYWTTRCSVEDGEQWDVHVERLEDGRWIQLFSYREECPRSGLRGHDCRFETCEDS